jgi:hypothetical protein
MGVSIVSIQSRQRWRGFGVMSEFPMTLKRLSLPY